MLTIPSYIKDCGIVGSPVSYDWRPYQGTELIEKYSKNLARLVQRLSLRANFSLAIGISEWMMWRLKSQANYPQLFLYINALWARTIDRAYLKVDNLDTPKDLGDPILGPLMALENALYTAFIKATFNHPERGTALSGLVSLVRFTLSEAVAFDSWLKLNLKKFGANFALQVENPAGSFVPRAFLDPTIPIEASAVPNLLDEQLQEIDWESNPFLATPDEMIAAGFRGIPYRFSS